MGIDMSATYAENSSVLLQLMLSVLFLNFTISNSKFLLISFWWCYRATGSELDLTVIHIYLKNFWIIVAEDVLVIWDLGWNVVITCLEQFCYAKLSVRNALQWAILIENTESKCSIDLELVETYPFIFLPFEGFHFIIILLHEVWLRVNSTRQTNNNRKQNQTKNNQPKNPSDKTAG